MATVKCHFDGHVFVPDDPVDLPVNSIIEITIDDAEDDAPAGVYVVEPKEGDGTARSILASGVGQSWAERDDIGDSVEFAHNLREKNQRRKLD